MAGISVPSVVGAALGLGVFKGVIRVLGFRGLGLSFQLASRIAMFLEASCRTSERHVRTRFMHVTLGAESFSFASTAGSLSCGGVFAAWRGPSLKHVLRVKSTLLCWGCKDSAV